MSEIFVIAGFSLDAKVLTGDDIALLPIDPLVFVFEESVFTNAVVSGFFAGVSTIFSWFCKMDGSFTTPASATEKASSSFLVLLATILFRKGSINAKDCRLKSCKPLSLKFFKTNPSLSLSRLILKVSSGNSFLGKPTVN